jgi:hypothetical protein
MLIAMQIIMATVVGLAWPHDSRRGSGRGGRSRAA